MQEADGTSRRKGVPKALSAAEHALRMCVAQNYQRNAVFWCQTDECSHVLQLPTSSFG